MQFLGIHVIFEPGAQIKWDSEIFVSFIYGLISDDSTCSVSGYAITFTGFFVLPQAQD